MIHKLLHIFFCVLCTQSFGVAQNIDSINASKKDTLDLSIDTSKTSKDSLTATANKKYKASKTKAITIETVGVVNPSSTNALLSFNLHHQDDFLYKLRSAPEAEAIQLMDSIFTNYNDFYPPVLYAASRVAYKYDEPYKALFLYYLAFLRTHIDANLCVDKTAKKVVTTLNAVYGVSITNFGLANVDSLTKTVNKVLEIADTSNGNYDHSWVVFYGEYANEKNADDEITKDDVLFNKERWPGIKIRAMNQFYSEFLDYLRVKKKIYRRED